jgi:hypothetical protein
VGIACSGSSRPRERERVVAENVPQVLGEGAGSVIAEIGFISTMLG